ncbi:uncharacterized protein LOC123564583 isoform X2 [Mercenaria mercenaria]|uniref:uncharacterized protein LOC123564583 isoform X2 n=1 Tax=Mercenaria mercenaria TaxID=6596 RepID=UPI00234E7400|nr:uncharacterized protein LOC123564583 isoform X2 [Mercenaria mercenaria]XP_053393202.1 uncharacterized protein LOC123564583 isoform X2 [Mercenaria mercenaria]XP_053393203.1 uncharacterized protein LOC123564583 isoform X2 [Mercenaria mercenaria]
MTMVNIDMLPLIQFKVKRYAVQCVALLIYFVDLCLSDCYVDKFQFPCFDSVCTFPLEYCSSRKYERRCIPCHKSLCKEDTVPQSCIYNCSSTDRKSFLSQVSNPAWFFVSIGLTVLCVSLILVLVVVFWKYRDLKKKKIPDETSTPLIDNTSLNNGNNTTRDMQSSYCEEKLKNITPVSDVRENETDPYIPTTYMEKTPQTEDTSKR